MGLPIWRGEKSLKTLILKIQVRMGLKLSNIGCPLIEPQITQGKVFETC